MTYFPLRQTTCFFISLVAPCKPLLVSLYTTLNRAAGVVLVGYPVLAVLLGQGTAAWLAAAAAGLSALEELVLHAWMPAPDVRGLLWIEKPRR